MRQRYAVWWIFFGVMLLGYGGAVVLFLTHLGTPLPNRMFALLELLAVSVVAFFFGSGVVTLGDALLLRRRSGTDGDVSHEPEK